MTRLEYFKQRYGNPKILDTYECRDFMEVVCRMGGDTLLVRVYGNEREGFEIYEKYKMCIYEIAFGKVLTKEMAEKWVKDMKPMAKWDYDTTTAVIYDIVESCIRQGINKIFLMNGHDGNIAPIEIASRKIKEAYPEAQIAALTQWWVAAGDLLPEGTFEVWGGLGHAGEGETSIAYYLFGEYCEPELATCVIPDLPTYLDMKWDFSELTDTAQTGDATKATKEKGKMMNDAIVEYVVKALKELDDKDWKFR